MQRDAAYALDVLLSARRALQITAGMTVEQFLADRTCQEAVLYSLLVMGEAAGKLSDEFKSAVPEVEWIAMIGLRNRLIHDYRATNLDLVWNLTRTDLPRLVTRLEASLPGEGSAVDLP